jgi:subtilase family serine protease
MSNRSPTKKIALLAISVILISLAEPVLAQGQTADLSLTSADITFSKDSPTTGEPVTINVKVHNNGPAVATNVVLDFTVSNIPLPPSKTIASIQPLQAGNANHSWVAPPPATYTIKVTVHGDQTDPIMTDNVAERTITVGTPVPTINVTATLSPNTIESKGLFWVNGTAKMGTTPVNGGDVKVEIVQNGFANESKTSTTGNFSVSMYGPAGEGKYNVKVTVKQGAVSGQTTLNLTVLQPDLNISKVTYSPKDPTEDDTVRIVVTVVNLGSGSAKAVTFQLKIDNAVALEKNLGNFAACQTQSVTYNWKAKKGNHDFAAVVDQNNTIEEIKENNNVGTTSITVKAKEKKPGPSFEAPLFIVSVLVIFLVMRNGRERNRKPRT